LVKATDIILVADKTNEAKFDGNYEHSKTRFTYLRNTGPYVVKVEINI